MKRNKKLAVKFKALKTLLWTITKTVPLWRKKHFFPFPVRNNQLPGVKKIRENTSINIQHKHTQYASSSIFKKGPS